MSEAGQGRRAASAIDALRRGWSVRVTGGDGGGYVVRAVETLFEGAISADACLLISAERAETLKITNQRAAAQASLPVLIRTPETLTPVSALAVADPALDLANPFKGPFTALPLDHPAAAAGAIDLTRFAGLLPAVLIEPDGTADVDTTKADIAAYRDPGSLRIAARAALPVADAPDSQIVVFRAESDAREHVALIVGARGNEPPLVRLHSECLTGDVFGSLKCDCGPQLHEAVHRMEGAGWGILLYLRQEGRGIGLVNKLRAYNLQDQGFDTVDANRRLGFADDMRDFAVAARMLTLLDVDRVRLLTNNPKKVMGLEQAGIAVEERLPIKISANAFNLRYLDTKRDRSGHQL
ncbi:GTP cyclohydrolase II [Novosphingopyxis baekryungensis]|uniref:GTP cyclohydrolase II n=1 Tax=Novosphingopyxis baekryungensis TaxID=279369 RepID=UPI0003B444D4|nr:GTP cyclohydrolase II [Novosphingopyxis baekryungensis]